MATRTRKNADHFRKAGRGVRCRACLKRKSTVSHHVVYEQELRSRGLPTQNVRNCMGLCDDCHQRHHNRSCVIPLFVVSDANLEYAFEILGAFAYDYLSLRYGGEDPRLGVLLAKAEMDER